MWITSNQSKHTVSLVYEYNKLKTECFAKNAKTELTLSRYSRDIRIHPVVFHRLKWSDKIF